MDAGASGSPPALDAWQFDPRPDLAEDSRLWHLLLMHCRATEDDGPDSLYGALHGFRCLGARLAVVKGRVRLFRGDITEDEYAALRTRWLQPHHKRLTELLESMDRWFGNRERIGA